MLRCLQNVASFLWPECATACSDTLNDRKPYSKCQMPVPSINLVPMLAQHYLRFLNHFLSLTISCKPKEITCEKSLLFLPDRLIIFSHRLQQQDPYDAGQALNTKESNQ